MQKGVNVCTYFYHLRTTMDKFVAVGDGGGSGGGGVLLLNVSATHSLRLQRFLWIYCPGYARVNGNAREDWQAQQTSHLVCSSAG